MNSLQKYASFIKLEHSLFSLPLLLSGAYLAQKSWPPFRLFILIIFAGLSARVVAMTLNRIIDKEIDKKNPRTKDRHLPSGAMSMVQGWAVGILSLLIYLYCSWLISPLCLKLSWIPVVAFVVYPYFKRYSKWTHIGLGLVWSLVPVAGFLSVHPSWNGFFPVLMIALFSVFWLAGFDIIYALQDEEFDRHHGVYSLPAIWGTKKALICANLFHCASFFFLTVLYLFWFSGPIAVMFLGIIGVLLFLESVYSHSIDFSFFYVNVVIGFIVLLFVIAGSKGV